MDDGAFYARDVDPYTPSAARIYHFLLTGEGLYGIDRVYGEALARIAPDGDKLAHYNRSFLRRAVTFMAERGIRQFLDVGAGLPTVGTVHEVARTIIPDTRVVYVDRDLDPVTRYHELLTGQGVLDTTAVIEADLRDPAAILDHPDTVRLIDAGQPVGLLIVWVWHFIADTEQPHRIMAVLRDRMPAGSYVAMSHVSLSDVDESTARRGVEYTHEYNWMVSDHATLRSRHDFTAFFDGWELVEPGIVQACDWRPTGPVLESYARRGCFVGVARKP
ncbi:SAM-dependent methyltransferase [Nocardia sp. alder85J]|uniref:SAM-dependent methyltransferase n=1 Tax=Nocardia sp. alder85J TaxID=2862949 RepID=UPI001CD3A75A|nr:SAM-dependent methyltransferase [Nocardia sp. alder85J]MCX4098380.1 SAM-dependent methyltransferase [Nocardia sp. alder85J]